MLLSVVIPVYNRSAELNECLMSFGPLLSYNEAELIVVDDGSDPVHRQAVEQMTDRFGARFVGLLHQGASAARNSGLDAARGEFVWFVDSDDSVVTASLPFLISSLAAMPTEAQVLLIGEMVANGSGGDGFEKFDGDAMRRVDFPDMLRVVSHAPVRTVFPRATNHTLLLLRRTWLMGDKTLRYPEGCALLEDTEFALRVVQKADCIMENPTLRLYCLHTEGLSTTSGAWSDERSSLFIGDVVEFFRFLEGYVDANDSGEVLYDLYRCYRFVYLRTLAVKGCPWCDIVWLRDAVRMKDPYVFAERLLFCKPIHKSISLLCRALRRRR